MADLPLSNKTSHGLFSNQFYTHVCYITVQNPAHFWWALNFPDLFMQLL